jgi:hypothetical protein
MLFYSIPLRPHSCYMPRPPHPPRLGYSNYTWRRVQILKLLVMQFSPLPLNITIKIKFIYIYEYIICIYIYIYNLATESFKMFSPTRRHMLLEKILTVVFGTQECWISGLCLSSGIINTRKHTVPETGSASVLRWGQGDINSYNPTLCMLHALCWYISCADPRATCLYSCYYVAWIVHWLRFDLSTDPTE